MLSYKVRRLLKQWKSSALDHIAQDFHLVMITIKILVKIVYRSTIFIG